MIVFTVYINDDILCVFFSLFFLAIQIFERDGTARDLWDLASAWAAAAVAIATAIAPRAAMVQSMVADQLTTTITTCSSSRTTIIASRTLLLLLLVLVVVVIIIIIITILHHRHIIIIHRHLLRRLKARDRRTCPFPWRYLFIATTIRTSRTDRSCTVTTTKTRRTCLKKVKTIKNILIQQVVFDNKKIIMINWHGKQSQRDWAPASPARTVWRWNWPWDPIVRSWSREASCTHKRRESDTFNVKPLAHVWPGKTNLIPVIDFKWIWRKIYFKQKYYFFFTGGWVFVLRRRNWKSATSSKASVGFHYHFYDNGRDEGSVV